MALPSHISVCPCSGIFRAEQSCHLQTPPQRSTRHAQTQEKASPQPHPIPHTLETQWTPSQNKLGHPGRVVLHRQIQPMYQFKHFHHTCSHSFWRFNFGVLKVHSIKNCKSLVSFTTEWAVMQIAPGTTNCTSFVEYYLSFYLAKLFA